METGKVGRMAVRTLRWGASIVVGHFSDAKGVEAGEKRMNLWIILGGVGGLALLVVIVLLIMVIPQRAVRRAH